MKNAVRRAGFRPLTCGRWHILLRPAALNIAAVALLVILLLALFGLTRGSFPMPSGTLFHALLGGENVGEQQRFILFDIRLPRLFMALLCGRCSVWPARRCRALPATVWRIPGLSG
ncbi:permease of ferrichrome ABC transporter [Klebsiella oxytoca]|nr:permease of ferrichrome ABC transporter [Klebsiella oxytoca]